MAPYVYTTTSICRVLLGLAVLCGLTLFADRGGWASDSDTTRATLRGWPGVFVAVEALDPAVERAGLTTRQLHTDVARRLTPRPLLLWSRRGRRPTSAWSKSMRFIRSGST